MTYCNSTNKHLHSVLIYSVIFRSIPFWALLFTFLTTLSIGQIMPRASKVSWYGFLFLNILTMLLLVPLLITSNNRLCSEYWIGEYGDGSGHGLICDPIAASYVIDSRKPLQNVGRDMKAGSPEYERLRCTIPWRFVRCIVCLVQWWWWRQSFYLSACLTRAVKPVAL